MIGSENGYFMNIAPEPASGTGVFRLVAELDGERILRVDPHIGFTHRGIEKILEGKDVLQGLVYADKLCRKIPFFGTYPYVLAVERLTGTEVPERARIIRVMFAETARVAAHLRVIGRLLRDAGNRLAPSIAEKACLRIDALISAAAGSPVPTYFRAGGVAGDVSAGACARFDEWAKNEVHPVLEELKTLAGDPVFRSRVEGRGVIGRERAKDFGLTGIAARAAGEGRDVRAAEPYDAYGQIDFSVPVGRDGDGLTRLTLRFDEIRQSLAIVRQAVSLLKTVKGRVSAFDRSDGDALADWSERYGRGLLLPEGEVYAAVESPLGETGALMVGNGAAEPYRCHFRSASFPMLQILPDLLTGADLADVEPLIGSLGIMMTEADR